jgi:DNA-binding Xre family transcriptional regulator
MKIMLRGAKELLDLVDSETSMIVQEVSGSDDPEAVQRTEKSHKADLAAMRSGTAGAVEFNASVPAKAAGSRLKQIFKQRGIKQSEIARRLGVAPSVISRVFKHPERSRLQTIRGIADAAGISVGELI